MKRTEMIKDQKLERSRLKLMMIVLHIFGVLSVSSSSATNIPGIHLELNIRVLGLNQGHLLYDKQPQDSKLKQYLSAQGTPLKMSLYKNAQSETNNQTSRKLRLQLKDHGSKSKWLNEILEFGNRQNSHHMEGDYARNALSYFLGKIKLKNHYKSPSRAKRGILDTSASHEKFRHIMKRMRTNSQFLWRDHHYGQFIPYKYWQIPFYSSTFDTLASNIIGKRDSN